MTPRSVISAACHTPRVGLGRSFHGKHKVLTGGVPMIKEATSDLRQGLSARPCFLMRKHLFAFVVLISTSLRQKQNWNHCNS